MNKSEVLRALGLKVRPGNYDTLNAYIKKLGLDTSHFMGQGSGKGKVKGKSIEQMLVENYSGSRHGLKKRLLTSGILENKCAICGLLPQWNGKTLVLVLDHKNGINDDCRLENLRFLCPNCNSQEPTFCKSWKNSNKRMRTKQCGCGKVISIRSAQCLKCSAKARSARFRKTIRPSLEELGKEITEFGYKATGKKYGVSDNTIRKWLNLDE